MGFYTKCHLKYPLATEEKKMSIVSSSSIVAICKTLPKSKLTTLYHGQKYQRVSNKYDLSEKN